MRPTADSSSRPNEKATTWPSPSRRGVTCAAVRRCTASRSERSRAATLIEVPIGCGGVAIYPGDIMVGDGEGVVCILGAIERCRCSRERILANLETVYREAYDRAKAAGDERRMLDLDAAYQREQLLLFVRQLEPVEDLGVARRDQDVVEVSAPLLDARPRAGAPGLGEARGKRGFG